MKALSHLRGLFTWACLRPVTIFAFDSPLGSRGLGSFVYRYKEYCINKYKGVLGKPLRIYSLAISALPRCLSADSTVTYVKWLK
jgi:hypothetical protein